MTPEEGTVALLIADATVNGIIAGRVFPGVRPQMQAGPSIIYRRIDRDRELRLGGESPLVSVQLRLDSWHTSQSGCRTLADAVRSAMLGVATDLGGLTVQQITLDVDTDLPEFEGDRRDFRVSQEYVIHYVEV